MSDFDVTEEWVGRVVVVAPAGELDLLTAPLLSDAIQVAAASNPTAMIVDLTKVTFLASAGMNALVAAHRVLAGTVRFGVVADGPATRRPLMLTGVDGVLTVFDLREEAISALAQS